MAFRRAIAQPETEVIAESRASKISSKFFCQITTSETFSHSIVKVCLIGLSTKFNKTTLKSKYVLCRNNIGINIYQISETEPKSSVFKLQPGNTILEGDVYDARKKGIQYTDDLDCLFTTVCLNNETDDCSYGADENYRE